jgi:hypothetical protein
VAARPRAYKSGVVTLLIRETEGPTLAMRRCGPLWRLRAYLCCAGLDRALAAGVSPDSSVQLSLRAHTLLSSTMRWGLADELHRLIGQAQQPRACFDPTVPLARSAILANRDEIEALADRLEAEEPVDVRGVAQVHALLRNGDSPVFGREDADELERALQCATEALDPFQCLV